MDQLKTIICLLLFCSGTQVFSQHSFDWLDSATYDLYAKGNWKQLSKLGKEVDGENGNYYYNNMRVGIAFYNRYNYNKAIHFFEKAQSNDASSPYPTEYLFWSEYLRGNEKDAYPYYQKLPDSIKARTDYHAKRILESVYLEGGVKLSDSTPIAGHVGYAQIGLNHKFSPAFSIYHAYTYQRQSAVWGHFQQHQYYIAPSIHFKKNLELTLAVHYAHYNGVLDFNDYRIDPPVAPPPPPPPFFQEIKGFHTIRKLGTYTENLLMTQISISKKIKGFKIAPHLGFFVNFQNPDYLDSHRDSIVTLFHHMQVIDSMHTLIMQGDSSYSKETRYEALFGTELAYDFGRFALGTDVTVVINKNVKTATVTPWIRIIPWKKLNLFAYFMYKNNYPLVLFEGSQLYNSLDKIKYKVSFTSDFTLTKKLNLYLTYQFEGINDNFSQRDYNLHTLLIGLNLRI